MARPALPATTAAHWPLPGSLLTGEGRCRQAGQATGRSVARVASSEGRSVACLHCPQRPRPLAILLLAMQDSIHSILADILGAAQRLYPHLRAAQRYESNINDAPMDRLGAHIVQIIALRSAADVTLSQWLSLTSSARRVATGVANDRAARNVMAAYVQQVQYGVVQFQSAAQNESQSGAESGAENANAGKNANV